MKPLLILLTILSILSISYAGHWAVLVAGSNGFWNYRHQSDICHAYHTLLKKGFSASKIIVFSYDDVANDPSNPFPGKLFNKPTYNKPGYDYYQGCLIDYRKDDVTPANFMKVLKGDEAGMKGVGTGKVLKSDINDRVFLYFADHGAPGLIAFPNEYLYANDLLATFNFMFTNKMYKELVFYLEACESGSMFQKLPPNLRIYAISAANPDESSWGAYCDPDDIVDGKHIGSCLGDLFSVNWMEDTDVQDTCKESMKVQYDYVQKKTNLSHVLQWGDVTFTSEPIGNFVGNCVVTGEDNARVDTETTESRGHTIDSRDIKFFYLKNKYEKNPTPENLAALQEEELSRHYFDKAFRNIAVSYGFHHLYDNKLEKLNLPGNLDSDCLKAIIETFEKSCKKLSEYALKHIRNFAMMCHYSNTQTLISTIEAACTKQTVY